jgi:hypothetical protein
MGGMRAAGDLVARMRKALRPSSTSLKYWTSILTALNVFRKEPPDKKEQDQ